MKRRLVTAIVGTTSIALAGTGCGSDVIVHVNGVPDTLTITVVDQNSVIVERLFLEEGDTAALGATALNALGQSVGEITPTWSSTVPSVASVTSAGTVLARSAGETQITAFYQNASATVPTTVTEPTTPPGPLPNQPPTAQIVSPSRDTTVVLGSEIDFQGSASDADGVVASHEWQFGDGNGHTIEDPGPYAHGALGAYTVSYQVTDDDGDSSTPRTRLVTVVDSIGTPPPPPPPPPPPGGVYFATDWGGALGRSPAAITDDASSTPWPSLAGQAAFYPNERIFEVFNTEDEGRDYPTPNFLRLRARAIQGESGWAFMLYDENDGYVPPVAVGDSVFIRYYFRYMVKNLPGITDIDTHGNEWGRDTPAGPPYGFTELFRNETWDIMIQPASSHFVAEFTTYEGGAYPFRNDVTYRIEHGFIRTGASTFDIRIRVYDLAGNLLKQTPDWNGWTYGQVETTLANTTFTTDRGSGWHNAGRWFRIGLNGIAGLTTSNEHDAMEWAAFVVCSSWCGPYPVDGVEN